MRPVTVMDREGDIFTLFRHQQDQGNLRPAGAFPTRPVTGPGPAPALGHLGPADPGRSPPVGPDRHPPAARAARQARVGLCWRPLTVPPPRNCADRHAQSVTLYGLSVRRHPLPGVKPLVWHLLTTVPITCEADAVQVLTWYRLRGRIDWHRVLKTRCRVTYLGHRTAGDDAGHHRLAPAGPDPARTGDPGTAGRPPLYAPGIQVLQDRPAPAGTRRCPPP